MGKLGKKARKFAKKNLQSVLKQRRKHKAMLFKRKLSSAPKNETTAEKSEEGILEQHTQGNSEGNIKHGAIYKNHFDNIFIGDDDNPIGDVSDSDGYLSEDPECPYISDSENENDPQEKSHCTDSLGQNKEIRMEFAKQKRILDKLQEKDPKFAEILESGRADLEQSESEDIYSDEEGNRSFPDGAAANESLHSHDKKVFTSSTIDVWCWIVMELPNGSALPNLLNGFRAACRYAIDSDANSSQRIPNREIFSKILTFVLNEADGLFRRLAGISDFSSKESILKLKDTSPWLTLRPLVKSYLRNSLFLLNQITDSQILVFVLSRLRVSTIFFAAFPSLAGRLIKISVHLWATGDESLSLSSFIMIHEIASQLDSACLDICLTRMYKTFIAHCKFVESTNSKHIEFLANSILEIYSLDIQKSYPMVLASVQQLANDLGHALKRKKKEELVKIYNGQYISCINLWVKFINCNIRDHELRPLLFLVIEIIRGVARLFPGPRHRPLRFKCVQLLNQLSLSSELFIPVASLVFDCLDYEENSNSNTIQRKPFNFSSVLKVPKQLLKSQEFQGNCILSAVELLAAHFSQWSYHISFPELAAIPLILLKRVHKKATIESLRRPVKRFIDQVERNIEFIQKKRDEVAFSPNDQAAVGCFLQLERSGGNAPFTQYYASVLQSSNSRATIN